MLDIYTILAYFSWILILLVWLPGYFTGKTSIKRPDRGRQIVTSIFLLAGFWFLFSGTADSSGFLGMAMTQQTTAFGVTGLVLDLAGIAFAIWARFALGRNWSGVITLKKDHELVQTGPYAIVRHPIYTGLLFGMFGTALTIGLLASYLGVACGLIAILIRIHDEDALMAKQFPQAHPAYRERIRSLIPFVW